MGSTNWLDWRETMRQGGRMSFTPRYDAAVQHPCPKCEAPPGVPCGRVGPNDLPLLHPARRKLAPKMSAAEYRAHVSRHAAERRAQGKELDRERHGDAAWRSMMSARARARAAADPAREKKRAAMLARAAEQEARRCARCRARPGVHPVLAESGPGWECVPCHLAALT